MRSGFSFDWSGLRAFFSGPQSCTGPELRTIIGRQSPETQAAVDDAAQKVATGKSREETVELNDNEAIRIIKVYGSVQAMYIRGGRIDIVKS
jgi:hypothetical protein